MDIRGPLKWISIVAATFLIPISVNSDPRTECVAATLRTNVKPTNAQLAVSKIFETAGVQVNGPEFTVKDARFYRRLLSDPHFQLGETYMDGMWESPHIDDLTARYWSAAQRGGPSGGLQPLWRTPDLAFLATVKTGFRYYRDSLTNRQTRIRSTTVAKEHYDAGNELYRRMLDPTMTYTSGVWAPGYSLEDAQNAKYDLIARKLDLKPGQHVLDIGSGFGGFARFAAKNYGAKVTGITISVEQLKAARALSAGLPEYKDVSFIFSDYRDIPYRFPPNTFDHVVSIEMIEAVGPKNLKDYFQAAHASLKDGGRFVIQAIANNKDVVNTNPWFSKYIFHDGVAPSTAQVDSAAKGTFGPAVDRQRITTDYDKTLLAWHDNFTKSWPEIKDQYSERFKRMWDFYLLSVAGTFRAEELQLDQSVFVKGEHRSDIRPVRELPSRERLDEMRATEEQKNSTIEAIGTLEDDKKLLQESVKPRNRTPYEPLEKNAKIAIIGAGPSGLSAAKEFQRLGYSNVVVFEKEAEAGGKTHTVQFDGRSHDLGATMGIQFKYAEIKRLAKENGQKTIPFPQEIQYDLTLGGPAKKLALREQLKMKYQGLLYLINYLRMSGFGDRALEVPPPELSDPWSVVMNRRGLGMFADQTKTYLTGYGYGDAETPAVFGMRMFDENTIMGAALAPSIMWENGTQPIWKGVASKLNVRTGAAVDRIERRDGDNKVYLNGSQQPEHFDKLVLAIDPLSALKILDATPEEKALFSQVKYTPYATFAVRVDGFSEGKSQVGYLKENMTSEREGHPMAWIKRYADDNLFVFHLFAPRSISDDQIMTNITEDMQHLGAGKVTLVDSRRWPFFPHVDAAAMRESHFYERVWNLQGMNGTVFANEALAMSTMPDSAELGRKVAQRLASGEYGR